MSNNASFVSITKNDAIHQLHAMRKFHLILLLGISAVSLVSAQPNIPSEPKAPSVEPKTDANKPNPIKQDNESREYPALVVFVNGSKIRGTIVLKDTKLTASCFCGNEKCALSEEIGKIKSVEFTQWKRDPASRRFRHCTTTITLRDGSKFNCARIPVFDRFALKREGKVLWCYTLYYRSESDKPKAAKSKAKKQHGVKLQPDESSQIKIEPHPDAVRKIEFLREEGKNLFDLLPLMMK